MLCPHYEMGYLEERDAAPPRRGFSWGACEHWQLPVPGTQVDLSHVSLIYHAICQRMLDLYFIGREIRGQRG